MTALADDHPHVKKLRKLFVRCGEAGLSQQDRLDLAAYLLRRDVTSFAELSEGQVERLLDATEGWQLIQHLRGER